MILFEFTALEKELLLSSIKARIATIKVHCIKDKESSAGFQNDIKELKGLIQVINQHQTLIIQPTRSLLARIVREHLVEPNKERIQYYFSRPNIELLNLSKKEEKEIECLETIINLGNDLLNKRERLKSLNKYLAPYKLVSKIQDNKIYYSCFDNNDIYKIGIPVSTKEYMVIDLDSNTRINYLEIKPMRGGIPTISFSSVGTKEEVVRILERYEKSNSLTERQKFVKELLIKNWV